MSKYEKFKVLGYIRPAEVFYSLAEWEEVVFELIDLQSRGFDTRSGEVSCKNASFCSADDFDRFIELINRCFGYQLNVETERYDLLTKKNVPMADNNRRTGRPRCKWAYSVLEKLHIQRWAWKQTTLQ